MGNALRFFCKPSSQSPPPVDEPQALGSHGVTTENIGVSALAQDLLHFNITSQVPPVLSQHVSSSKKAQASWYNKLLKAWNEAKPPPKESEVAAKLIIQTLQHIGKSDLEGFLAFYGLPCVPQTTEEDIEIALAWPEGVQFELLTLPIQAIGDGDGFTAYVNTAERRESKLMPHDVKNAIIMRKNARAAKDFAQEKLIKKSVIAAGYRFLKLPNQQEILARKYRIRLR